MLGSLVPSLLAVAVIAGAAAPQVGAVATTAFPPVESMALGGIADDVEAMALAALPPPPTKAVLVTQSYGTITLDHRAHLARKITCKTCHGPGVVSKFGRLPPREAHERCVTCHREGERGPTKCRECHTVKQDPKPADVPPVVAQGGADPNKKPPTMAALVAAEGAGKAELAGRSAGAPSAALAAAVPQGPVGGDLSAAKHDHSMRTLETGYTAFNRKGAPTSYGPSLSISLRNEGFLMVYSFERDFAADGRTLGFLGVGTYHRIRDSWNVLGTVVGGFSAGGESASFIPMAGVRVGTEYIWRRMSFGIAVTGATNLTTDAAGRGPGDLALSYMASIGYVLGRD